MFVISRGEDWGFLVCFFVVLGVYLFGGFVCLFRFLGFGWVCLVFFGFWFFGVYRKKCLIFLKKTLLNTGTF